ncbi:MAG: hypothetical protein ACUVQY_00390 [Thermoproteota archaeon]
MSVSLASILRYSSKKDFIFIITLSMNPLEGEVSVIQGLGDYLNTLEVGVDKLRSDDPWEVIAGIGVTIAGALETALYGLCVALPNIIGGWIKTAAEYVWNGIKVTAEIDQRSRSVIRYFISTDPNVPITGVLGITRHLFDQLGFLPTAPISEAPCEKLVDYPTTYGFDYDASISNVYVPQYYPEGSRILWQFNSTTYNLEFLSPDETVGTRTF